jgi:hypothetical protein
MQHKAVGFLAALGMVTLLAMSACSKSDQTPPAEPRVSDSMPAPQGNSPASPPSAPSAPGSSSGSSRSGGY